MRFLFDHNFSPIYAEMLRLYGFPTSSLPKEYPDKIKDIDWLRELKDTDWIVVDRNAEEYDKGQDKQRRERWPIRVDLPLIENEIDRFPGFEPEVELAMQQCVGQ